MSNLNTNFNPASGEYGSTVGVLGDVAEDNGAPSAMGDGVTCDGWARAILTIEVVEGTSILFEVYKLHRAAGTWHKDTTVGDVTVAADASTYKVIDCGGWGRIYIRAKTFTGEAEGTAWISLSNDRP